MSKIAYAHTSQLQIKIKIIRWKIGDHCPLLRNYCNNELLFINRNSENCAKNLVVRIQVSVWVCASLFECVFECYIEKCFTYYFGLVENFQLVFTFEYISFGFVGFSFNFQTRFSFFMFTAWAAHKEMCCMPYKLLEISYNRKYSTDCKFQTKNENLDDSFDLSGKQQC